MKSWIEKLGVCWNMLSTLQSRVTLAGSKHISFDRIRLFSACNVTLITIFETVLYQIHSRGQRPTWIYSVWYFTLQCIRKYNAAPIHQFRLSVNTVTTQCTIRLDFKNLSFSFPADYLNIWRVKLHSYFRYNNSIIHVCMSTRKYTKPVWNVIVLRITNSQSRFAYQRFNPELTRWLLLLFSSFIFKTF
jgi:hypothetical protein